MTPIQKKYQETGAESGFLGTPITSEIQTPNGLGIYQEFQFGIIYFSSDYGACVLKGQIVEKWKSDSVAKALTIDNKTTVRDYLGFPIRDTETTRNGQVCYFERGMIITIQNLLINSFAVYGQIYVTYRKHNDINGWMGFPKSDEQVSANGGRVSWFENADIYWHPNVGSFEVHGAIKDKYNVLGASASFLGYPISDENILLKGGNQIGRSSSFEFGTIFWNGATGAFEMHGSLVKSYLNQFEGPSGVLGFPTSDELSSPNGSYRFNNFQNGILTCNMFNGMVRKATNLRVVFTQFETDEDDDDLLVLSSTTLSVFGNVIQRIDKSFGEYSNTGTKTLSFNEGFIGDFPLRDGNASLNVFMKSWEVDGGFNGPDDVIGEFSKSFSLERYWDSTLPDTSGNNLLTWYNGPDGKFRASLRIEVDNFEVNPLDSTNFRRDLFWNIHNPTIPNLEFSTFASTFSDVEEDDTALFHWFNHIFYQAAYKTSAKTGTCFGMCVEAIYALKGRSASRQPIGQYGFDEQRKQDILVKFGYQLGASQINFLISKLKSGGLWNPIESFFISRDLFNNGNYPVLCISKDFSIAGGHAVLPYRWDDSNPNEWLIFIANPNTPFNENNDNHASDSVIKINPQNNTFSYQHSLVTNWSGGQGFANGGRMFAFPYNELSTEPRTPFWEVILTIITGGAYLIFAGDAEVEQITDGNIGTFYNEQGTINTDFSSRLKNIIPIETLSDPDDTFSDISMRIENVRFNNVFRLINTNKSKMFYLKNERLKGKMYVDQTELRHSLRTTINSSLIGHIRTSIHSNSFARNINSTNFNQLLNNETNSLESFEMNDVNMGRFRNDSLTFDLRGTQDGNYMCGFACGKSKILVSSNTNARLIDQITIENINNSGQAFTFKANELALNKLIKIVIISFDEKRRYELNNISVVAGQTITFQHNDACKELIIHNSQQTLNLELKLFINNSEIPILTKENILIEPLNVVHFEPTNWIDIDNQISNTPIKMDIYDKLGGVILNSKML